MRNTEEFRRVEQHATTLACAWCGWPSQLWQRRSPGGVWQSFVACSNSGGGALEDDCPLYMPPEAFYRARKRDAIEHWNRWILNRAAPASARAGPFVTANAGSYGQQDRYRTLELGGMSGWTADMQEALWFARRQDAERFAADDEDAWRILPVRTELLASKHHKLDTDSHVFFYEQEFYVLSNFSAFALTWKGQWFPTSEHAYHWEKFPGKVGSEAWQARTRVKCALSAHEAFKLAEKHRALRRPDWDDVKVDIMRDILRAKAGQHEYVRRKLLESGDRVLVEDSWRDPYWGWGPNRDGQNMLGKLWMEVRAELRATPAIPKS